MNRNNLKADCNKCFGLCCIALHFAASDGFPEDKVAGQPCVNLRLDFRCNVHEHLQEKGLKGCMAYDCYGSGQKISTVSFKDTDWRIAPESASRMIDAFLIMYQLHELLWYITNAQEIKSSSLIYEALCKCFDEVETLTYLNPLDIIKLDMNSIRARANDLLIKASELLRAEICLDGEKRIGRQIAISRGANLMGADLRKTDLRGMSLRGVYLIAADLRGLDLSGTDLIGADFRDADIRGTNLAESIYLTQSQVNVAKGNSRTRLPNRLVRPSYWGD